MRISASRNRGDSAHVWVLIPAVRRGYEADIFLSLRAALAEASPVDVCWSFDPDDLLARRGLAGGKGVGVIVGHWPRATLQQLERVPCAVSDLMHLYETTGGAQALPALWRAYAPDDFEIGRMIARHFIERRLTRFACVNPYAARTSRWAAMRMAGFLAETGEAGSSAIRAAAQQPEKLREWLGRLPKPAGVFCVTDKESALAAEACRRTGISVPGQIALAGVNNDPAWVEATSPTLSSVVLPAHEIGQALAKAVLGRLKTGAWPTREPPLIPPRVLLARASTDTLAVTDARVRAAVAFLRARSGIGIGVEDLCRAAGLNRRSLEILFRKHLGQSPYAILQGARLERAWDLVNGGALPITEIASQCNLPIDRFGALFRKRFGLRPLALRLSRRSV